MNSLHWAIKFFLVPDALNLQMQYVDTFLFIRLLQAKRLDCHSELIKHLFEVKLSNGT